MVFMYCYLLNCKEVRDVWISYILRALHTGIMRAVGSCSDSSVKECALGDIYCKNQWLYYPDI